ncbi:MAG: hypothetical protein K9K39_03500 [Desulfohalobiaceae bacterium]|nr:hypothetical protein [Desulfohalobiaceae bacterium]
MPCLIRTLAPLLALLFLWPGVCLGHGVNVFCWSQEDNVQCRARFSGGRAVHNGSWKVLDSSTQEKLLQGKTNSKGRFSFSPPPKARKNRSHLKVVCEASMGHRDSWLVRTKDYISGVSEEEKEQGFAATEESAAEKPESIKGIREERIRSILRQELSPLRKELAELRENRIGIRDVLGGLGYILGLFGIWAYTASRRESPQ